MAGTTIQDAARRLLDVTLLMQLTQAGGGGSALMIVFGLLFILGAILTLGTLLVRQALIVVAVVVAPLAFAGGTARITSGWVRRWVQVTLALILSKLAIVIVFVVAVGMVGDATGIGALLSGLILLLLACLAPWACFKVLDFAGTPVAGEWHRATNGSTIAVAQPGPVTAQSLMRTVAPIVGGAAGAAGAGAGPPGAPVAHGRWQPMTWRRRGPQRRPGTPAAPVAASSTPRNVGRSGSDLGSAPAASSRRPRPSPAQSAVRAGPSPDRTDLDDPDRHLPAPTEPTEPRDRPLRPPILARGAARAVRAPPRRHRRGAGRARARRVRRRPGRASSRPRPCGAWPSPPRSSRSPAATPRSGCRSSAHWACRRADRARTSTGCAYSAPPGRDPRPARRRRLPAPPPRPDDGSSDDPRPARQHPHRGGEGPPPLVRAAVPGRPGPAGRRLGPGPRLHLRVRADRPGAGPRTHSAGLRAGRPRALRRPRPARRDVGRPAVRATCSRRPRRQRSGTRRPSASASTWPRPAAPSGPKAAA